MFNVGPSDRGMNPKGPQVQQGGGPRPGGGFGMKQPPQMGQPPPMGQIPQNPGMGGGPMKGGPDMKPPMFSPGMATNPGMRGGMQPPMTPGMYSPGGMGSQPGFGGASVPIGGRGGSFWNPINPSPEFLQQLIQMLGSGGQGGRLF